MKVPHSSQALVSMSFDPIFVLLVISHSPFIIAFMNVLVPELLFPYVNHVIESLIHHQCHPINVLLHVDIASILLMKVKMHALRTSVFIVTPLPLHVLVVLRTPIFMMLLHVLLFNSPNPLMWMSSLQQQHPLSILLFQTLHHSHATSRHCSWIST